MQKKNLLLLICVLFAILYVDAKTDFKKIDDLYYNLDATSMQAYVAPPNKSQYDFTKQNGVIKIPSTVVHKKKVYNVVSIGNESFKDCKTLKSIDIPNSVTYIGSQAFSGCSGLTSIEIPNSVTYIGDEAYNDCPIETLSIDCQNIKDWFAGNNSLKKLIIGNSVTSIEHAAFRKCTSLTNVTIGNSVNIIGEAAFIGCKSLTDIVIPNSVTKIEKFAFNNCGLTSVTIGNSVISIGEGAFMSCNGLTSVVIPDSVTTIEQLAFWHCKGLKNVILGRSISKIGKAAFNECGNLREVEFNSENCTFCGKDEYIRYNFDKIAKSYPLVNGSYAFYGFYGIDKNGIESLKEGKVCGLAFPSNLKILKIGNKVKLIPNDAFYGCSGLTSVEIPNTVTEIGNSAFSSCSGLTSVTIGNSVTSIGKYAFSGCSGLTSVIIGNSVTSIGDYAFYHCSNIKNITLPISITTFGKDVFAGCGSVVKNAYEEWINRAGTQGNEFAKNILDERRQAEAREAEDQREEEERQERLRAGAQYVIKFKGEYYDTYIYLYPDGRAYDEKIGKENAQFRIIKASGTWKILRRYIGNSFKNYFSISTKTRDSYPHNYYMFVNGDKIWSGTDSFDQLDYRYCSPATIEKLK